MLIQAHILQAPTPEELSSIPDGALVLDESSGEITALGPATEITAQFPDEPVFPLPENARPLLLPGLIDVHAHLPQFPAVARREASLLPWLETHIFPLEQQFRSEQQRPFIEAFFDEVVANGLTTIVLYAAIWEDTTDLAFQVAAEKGIRAIIGKVMMDVHSYGETLSAVAREKSLAQTVRLIEKWHRAENGRLDYAVSPRFAVTCSMDMMREAAQLARRHDTYIQTHLSENHAEIETVAQLFPDSKSYTDVYYQAGLLTPKTLLGHCIHLSPDEMTLIADADAKIAHCPTSNFFLNSGIMPIDRIDRAGISFGVASDVAGGPELNPWQVLRSAIEGQKARAFTDPEVPELTPTRALHLATTGGAHVLSKSDTIGQLQPNFEADLTLLDLNQILPLGGRFSPPDLDPDQILTACIYRGTPSATLATFVRGKQLNP
ncbi:MAG: guanine deaminase [Verrucomicrobiota bacterium]